MNRISLLCLVSVLTLSAGSCKKSDDDGSRIIVDPPMGLVTGSWKLVVSQGGMTPAHIYTGADSTYTVQFTGTGYSFKTDNVVTRSGNYELRQDTTFSANVCLAQPPQNPYYIRVVFDGNNTENKTFLQVRNDSLFMASGCFAYDAGKMAIYKHIQ